MKSKLFKTVVSGIALFSFSCVFSQNGEPKVGTLVKNFMGNGSVVVGQDGNIFVNEYGTANSNISGSGTHIYKVSAEGNIIVVSDKVNGAVGNAISIDGTYYFNNGNSFEKSDFMSLKDEKLKKIATLQGFSGDILIDKKNEVFYIPSYTHPVLRKVSMTGEIEDYVTDERLKGITGITYGENGIIFLSNFITGKIYKLDKDGSLMEHAMVPTVYPGYVVGYITYYNGHLYATGYGSNIIYSIDMNGGVEVLAGSGDYSEKDGTAEKASFITPNGIDVDANKGRLYITQNGNGKPASLRYIDLSKD